MQAVAAVAHLAWRQHQTAQRLQHLLMPLDHVLEIEVDDELLERNNFLLAPAARAIAQSAYAVVDAGPGTVPTLDEPLSLGGVLIEEFGL